MKKAERHLLYKKILKRYNKSVKERNAWGICGVLLDMCMEDEFDYRISDFPELMAYKPTLFFDRDDEETSCDYQFWFRVSDTTFRIALLKRVIKETK